MKRGKCMYNIYEENLKELKRTKDEQIEYARYSKSIREKLMNDEYLERKFVDFLNKVFLNRDRYVFILDVLKLGEEFGLDKDKFHINATRKWKLTVGYAKEEDKLKISVYDKTKEGEGALVECVCPSKYYYDCRGKVYIKRRLFCEIEDKKIGDVVEDAMATIDDKCKESLRDLVFTFKVVDFYDCFDKSVDKIIQEQKKLKL